MTRATSDVKVSDIIMSYMYVIIDISVSIYKNKLINHSDSTRLNKDL